MLENFNSHWGSGDEGTVWNENFSEAPRRRQKGLPRKVLLAAALDPRTKAMVGVPEQDQIVVWSDLKTELLKLVESAVPGDVEPVRGRNATANTEEQPDAMEDFFAAIAGGSLLPAAMQNEQLVVEDPHLVAVTRELESYKEEEALLMVTKLKKRKADQEVTENVYNNPLEWWKNCGRIRYPTLAKLARRILCIPATSAPSERLFSVAGQIISKNRARLHSDTATDIIFLNQNWKVAEATCNGRMLD
jgi:hypothetical protein